MSYRMLDAQTIYGVEPNPKDDSQWWRTAIFYEVYVRSFQDSNDDGIGDLRGIEQRLPYLKQLGIDAIWITPFFVSPMADYGYDVSDYTDIDPIFGTTDTFDSLLNAAHELNIKVVIDFVPNHTSDQHPWFIESRSSRTNPKRDWYIWSDSKPNGDVPNNWTSFFGGKAWTWDAATSQYYLHLFLDSQPDLNWRNPEVVRAMGDVLHFWLKKGVDGFRLDAITFLIKHADLPDMPAISNATGADLVSYHIYTNNQPELHTVLRNFRSLVDSYAGNRVLIGETGALQPAELAEFYGTNLDELQLPMIVLPLHAAWQANSMRECLTAFYASLPHGAIPHFVFGNHDDTRLTTRYGEKNHRSIGMLLLTLLGTSILYYGDEIAMTDTFIPTDKRRDPSGQSSVDDNAGRDPVRTPMQWTPQDHVGFTSDHVMSWLPVNGNRGTVNVQSQEQDPYSTLNFYKQLLQIRQQSGALLQGSIQFLEDPSDHILAYLRNYGDERMLVAINFSDAAQTLDLSNVAFHAQCLLSSRMQSSEIASTAQVVLHPHESILLKLT